MRAGIRSDLSFEAACADPIRRSALAAIAAAVLAGGCGTLGIGSKTAKITLEAGPDLNPDVRGRPSPVTVRVFELSSLANFDKADFFALFDRDRETLGPELIGRQDVVLKPGDRQVVQRKLPGEARFVGILVGFRDLERAQWRLSMPVEAALKDPVIQLSAARVALKGQ
jgi:type VI secretion system protein VasD